MLARLDGDMDVFPEERVVNAEVVHAGAQLDVDGLAEDQGDSEVSVHAHEDLSLTTVGRMVTDEPDDGTEIVGVASRGGPSCGHRPVVGPENGWNRHFPQGNADLARGIL